MSFNVFKTDKDKKQWDPYPVGIYELEIQGFKKKTGTNSNGDVWEQAQISTKIVTPDDKSGKPFTAFLFYNDYKFTDILIQVSKKPLKDVGDSSGDITDDQLSSLLEGKFIKVKLGITEYNGKKKNEIVEVIQEKKVPQAQLDV